MSGAGLTIERRLRALLGSDATIHSEDADVPCVAPRTEEACALVLRTARDEAWTVRLAGGRSWSPLDAPADLTLTSAALKRVEDIKPADLVATAQSGVTLEQLRRELGDHGVWLPVDPPGKARTLGSIVATATAGPLRSGFGAIRDHLLGLSVVTTEGRIVRAGGRMVKDVAGFDLTKLAIGSFGTFGLVTSLHLRLRAVPRADHTLVAEGDRDRLIQEARAALDAGLAPASLEVLSPAAGDSRSWLLAVRLAGADPAVQSDRDAVRGACSLPLNEIPKAEVSEFWARILARATDFPTTLRLGALVTSLDDAADLLAHHLSPKNHLTENYVSVSVPAGVIRWSGSVSQDRLLALRRAAAQQEMPITVERAPWDLRSRIGHFGAYREGVGRLVGGLRQTFDPRGILVVPLSAEE